MENYLPTAQIAQRIESIVQNYQSQRKPFERRWYNNNFFDDGYHYRFVSRTTGRIVDLNKANDTFIPYRAIPKASRQIRGIANLLIANEPFPVVYPEKINAADFMSNQQAYQKARQTNKTIAKRTGQWIEKMWKDLEIFQQIVQMVILSAKHGVSYMQVYSKDDDIATNVYDAFEVYLNGSLPSIYDCPVIVKACPTLVADIKANEDFDEEQREELTPDNKYASSEIKEAYMRARYGNVVPTDTTVSLILKEAFIKERVDEYNKDKIKKDLQDDSKSFEEGDTIIRKIYECSGIWLYDKYTNSPDYPFVDFRFEPGPIYQVPLIERFIPANKSLDAVMSRVERHIGTMAVGAWLKRRGENFKISNMAGGQVLEYQTTPPVQATVQGFPSEIFAYINQINSIIEEQGATTSALGNVPSGVKSGVAIESLKASEYANMKIATSQLKSTVKRISEKMLDIASSDYMDPKTVYRMDGEEPDYFDVIGEEGMKKYENVANKKGAMIQKPDAIPLKKDYKVEIEIQSGMGYTEEGKRNTMIQIIDYMTKMSQLGMVNPQSVQVVLNRFLEIFQFGNTAEFMQALEEGTQPLTQTQIQQMKIALMEVVRDLQKKQEPQAPPPSTGVDQPAQGNAEEDILKIKTGFMEAMKDLKSKGEENAIA